MMPASHIGVSCWVSARLGQTTLLLPLSFMCGVYVCSWLLFCMWDHMCVFMYVETRGKPQMAFLRYYPLCVLRQGLSWDLEPIDETRLAGQPVPGMPLPPGARITGTAFYVGAGFLSRDCHARKRSTLLAEPSSAIICNYFQIFPRRA